MSSPDLQEIEAKFVALSTDEQRWLLDRLTAGLRQKNGVDLKKELAAMAADPDIQREIRGL